MGTILKEESENSVFNAVCRNLIIVYIFIFMSVNKQQQQRKKCMHALYCDIIRIKEDCC